MCGVYCHAVNSLVSLEFAGLTVFKSVDQESLCATQSATMLDVSVIIAAYNSDSFVEKAINSALNQEGVSLEVIVVDDASLDSTVKVVEAINDPRVRLLKHKNTQWPGSARNTAISHARGQWLAVLDSDDEFEPNRLSKLKMLAEQTDCQLVCDNLLVCNQSDRSTKLMFSAKRLESLKSMSLTKFIEGNLGNAKGYTLGYFKPFVQRDFLEQHNVRYPTTMNIGEDYFMLAELLAAGAKCVVDPHPYYRYAVRPGSMSDRVEAWTMDNILTESLAFEQRHTFDSSVTTLLRKRHDYIVLNRAFLRAIAALKGGKLCRFFGVLFECPKVIAPLARSAITKRR